ncbi:LacI family transcriptional regulator [Streptomyces sp. NBC_01725]|uniref:LacI family DNA-binding transcriptional regulator n=1 Tax=Streptomyces sp. NBC_01725 TaxID=2975923 RepID=UPI002E2BBC1E|nr:LacI family DNA-binding transcriptional regulator [Streptomyces sp. NBC_01725]
MITLAEVARHAGVSASTVSYVLSGKRSISPGTCERVERSIHELGYHAGARALAGGKSDVIALVLPLRTDTYAPVTMETVLAVTTTARTYGYDVLLLTGDDGPAAVRRATAGALADAMILMDAEPADERLPLLRESDKPSVLIGLPADPTGLTCVDLDFTATGALCAEHLAALGHRDIALITEPPAVHEHPTGSAGRTLHGLRAKSRELGLSVHHLSGGDGRTAMTDTLAHTFAEHPATTGFVVQHEPAVEALLHSLRRLGRPVPEDISVIAICPDRVALHSSVPLTSVAIPTPELGRRAVDRIIAELTGEGAADITLIPPALTTRTTSGPAPV